MPVSFWDWPSARKAQPSIELIPITIYLIDHTVGEAKGEIDAFVTHVVQQTGLDAIRRGQVSLGFDEPDGEKSITQEP
jgi:hypothetical protein